MAKQKPVTVNQDGTKRNPQELTGYSLRGIRNDLAALDRRVQELELKLAAVLSGT